MDSDNDNGITDADDLIEADPFSPDKPGKWGWVNNDDSDGDGFEDNQNNTIDGAGDLEDIGMLVVRNVDVSNLANPKLLLRLGNTGLIRVFRLGGAGATAILGPGLANPVDLIQELGLPVGWTLGMEGVAQGTTTLTLTLLDGATTMCSDTVRVTVIGLNVIWETAGADPQPINAPNDHPSGTLGVKVFPGATATGGGFNDVVGVRVSTSPQVANVPVFLKAFDPDDPSANNDVVDDDLLGGDNRDANHQDTMELGSTQLVTDANGETTTTFRVAHQPGDNHRVAATIKQTTQGMPTLNMLNDNNVTPSNTDPATQDQVALFIGHISPLLTVWRKIHMELAAMQRPMFPQNTWSGTWSSAETFTAPGGGQIHDRIVLHIQDLDVDNNQLGNGWIQIQGAGLAGLPSFRVFESLDELGNDTITVLMPNGIGTLMGVMGGNFIVSDDDLSDQVLFDTGVAAPGAPGSFGADVTRFGVPLSASLPFPDTQNVDTLYAPAYILPIVDGFNNGIVPFVQNLPQGLFGLPTNTDSYFLPFLAVRSPANPVSTQSFWTALVGSGFQSNLSEDADPEVQVTKGASPHKNGATCAHRLFGSGTNFTGILVVFLETIRDAGGTAEFRIVAHEMAHTLGVPHASDGCGGLMEERPPVGSVFLPASLKTLREYVEP